MHSQGDLGEFPNILACNIDIIGERAIMKVEETNEVFDISNRFGRTSLPGRLLSLLTLAARQTGGGRFRWLVKPLNTPT